jgi:hypothetical protein
MKKHYWETCSEAIKIVRGILNIYKIEYTFRGVHGELTDDNELLYDEKSDEEFRYRFDFKYKYDSSKYITIIINANEIESNSIEYDGQISNVYFFDDEPISDGITLESGDQLIEELHNNGFDLKHVIMKMNENKSKVDRKWEWKKCSEAIKIIRSILNIYKVDYITKTTYGELTDKNELLYDQINDDEAFRYKFLFKNKLKGGNIAIMIHLTEKYGLAVGIWEPGYNNLKNGNHLIKKLHKNGFDLKHVIMKMNENKGDRRWEWKKCSEAIKIIRSILNIYKVDYEENKFVKEYEYDKINDEESRVEFIFKKSPLQICIFADDLGDGLLYDGGYAQCYLYTDEDDIRIDDGKHLMKLLNKEGIDLKNTMLKMNTFEKSNMKYLKSFKVFERNNKFINSKTFDLQKWYDKLNKHFWGGKLPKVDLRWNNAKSELGVLKWDQNSGKIDHLGLSDEFKLTQEELLSVLAHEMIHVWQVFNNKTDGHGANFIKEMERINKKSKWGIKVLPKQPMEHLKMTNPDLKTDYGFILIKNKKDDFDICVYDPKKTDHKNLLTIIQQNLKKNSKVDVEVRLTQNGVVKKYEGESTNSTLKTYKIDELTFNTLMNDSRKIYGGTLK